MKLAARREKDEDDVVLLVHKLGLKSREEVIEAVEKYFKADLSAASHHYAEIIDFLDLIIDEGKLVFG